MKAIRKNFFREIRYSLGRFLSILFIVALGTAFFSGIRATEPDMRASMDAFVREHHFMDLRVRSSLGLTQEDVKALGALESVSEAEGAYSVDVLTTVGDTTAAVKAMSVPGDMNKITVKKGRLPKNDKEVLVDRKFAKERKLKIGDRITLASGTEDKLSDSLKHASFQIVGTGDAPEYLTASRGNTSVGNGTIAGFLILDRRAFAMDVYTSIYLRSDALHTSGTYDAAYKNGVEQLKQRAASMADERCGIRLANLKQDIRKAEKKLSAKRADLVEAKKKYRDAREELAHKKADTREKFADAEKTLKDRKWKIGDGIAAYRKNKQKLEEQEQQLAASRKKLDASGEKLKQAWAQYEQTKAVNPNADQVKKQLQQKQAEYDAGVRKLKTAGKKLTEGKQKLAKGYQQMLEAKPQIAAARRKLGEKKGKAASQFRRAEKKLEKNGRKITAGENKLKKAEKKVKTARKDVEKLGKGTWYVQTRNEESAYAEYDADANKIGSIGTVFPMIFFLVAALVSLTGMTRMVEEQRGQIGLLEALGYGKGTVLRKFASYCLLATVAGSVTGVLTGEKFLPYFIITAYGNAYQTMDTVRVPYHIPYALLAAGAAIGCNLLATLLACQALMRSNPAQLMRPVAPKSGNQILLERMGFFWKKLKFSQKATLRNLFRYKQRLLMTVFGIGGCTALILVGYGVKDSVTAIMDRQFGVVWNYDAQLAVDTDASGDRIRKLDQYLARQPQITAVVAAYEDTVEIGKNGSYRDGYLIVPEDPREISACFDLHNRETGELCKLAGDGVVVTEKLAKLYGLKPGDSLEIRVNEEKEPIKAKISAIAENYLQHYVYLTPKLYEKLYGEKAVSNQRFFRWEDAAPKEQDPIISRILDMDAAQQVIRSSDVIRTMNTTMDSLYTVVGILIASAGLLAFVVIFNLNNISITERRRELATLKVLGFYDGEVAMYVYRENILLTFLGIIVGLGLGVWLHHYIMGTVETDSLMFGRAIEPVSFVWAVVLTLLFAVIVNGFTFFSLKRIDMIESLKSVE